MQIKLTDDMTLEEKLKAIDEMMANAVIKAKENPDVPIDPSLLTICEGCEWKPTQQEMECQYLPKS